MGFKFGEFLSKERIKMELFVGIPAFFDVWHATDLHITVLWKSSNEYADFVRVSTQHSSLKITPNELGNWKVNLSGMKGVVYCIFTYYTYSNGHLFHL